MDARTLAEIQNQNKSSARQDIKKIDRKQYGASVAERVSIYEAYYYHINATKQPTR